MRTAGGVAPYATELHLCYNMDLKGHYSVGKQEKGNTKGVGEREGLRRRPTKKETGNTTSVYPCNNIHG